MIAKLLDYRHYKFMGGVMRNLRNYALFLIVVIAVSMFISCDARITGLLVSPEEYDFKVVNLGDSKSYYFRVSNKSNDNFIVTNFSFMGIAANDYKITMGGNTPLYLQAGRAEILAIEFEPTAAGVRSARLMISHTGSNGVNQIFLTGLGLPVPRLNVSDTELDFKIVYVNILKTHDFEFENVGTSVSVISNILLEGSNTSLYCFPNGKNTPIIIDPDTSTTVTLGFTPLADGSFPCTMKVFHNAINLANPLIIQIKAEGVTYAPEILLDKTSPWDFGLAPVGYPTMQDITITSTGIDPLTITNASLSKGIEFKIISKKDKNAGDINFPISIINGDYIVIRFEFSTTATTTYDDIFSIVHDGINENTPLEFELKGEGKVPVIQNLSYTGSPQQFTVPAGVFSVRVLAKGAGGGGPTGGAGGLIEGTATVQPGETYTIVVGGKGNNATYARSANGGGGFSGLIDSQGNHVVTAGGAGGCAGTGGSPYGSGGNGGGVNGGNGGCGQGGAGGVNGPSATGGIGGVSGGQPGLPGTSIGGGNGGNGMTNQASGGGGGGFGTGKGTGGTQYQVAGKGGDGGYGGGGGAGGGGWGSTNSRMSAGGGGGGGYAGGGGGTAPTGCGTAGGGGGGGGSNYVDTNKASSIRDEAGQGAARGTNGTVQLIY